MGLLKSKKNNDMWLLVGLGNPGSEYERHRHNIGFRIVDRIADIHSFPVWKKKYSGLYTEDKIGEIKVGLLKPQTYMNLSGQSVAAAARFFKITPERIFVFHDELDLPFAKLRVKNGGGNAGHNGLESIQDHLSTPAFNRVRLGISHPGDKDRVHGHVLGNFSKDEELALGPFVDNIAKHAGLLFSNESEFMSKVAMDSAEKKDKKKAPTT